MVTNCEFQQTIDFLGGSVVARTQEQMVKSYFHANANNR